MATVSTRPRTQLAVGIVVISLAIAVVLVVPQLRHCVSLVFHGQFTALRNYIRSLGAGGFALLLGLMLVHAVIWYPSEIITATAGFVYGFVPGTAFCAFGWLLCGLLAYSIGSGVGRPLLQRLLGSRFDQLAGTIERGGSALLISGRLIPVVPFAFLGYAAGTVKVNLLRYSWTTFFGYLPLTIAVAYLGSQAQTLSASNPLLWIAVAALLTLLVGERVVGKRLMQRRPADDVRP